MMPLRIAFLLVGFLLTGAFGSLPPQREATIPDKDMNVTHFENLAYPAVAGAIQGVVVVRVRLDNQGKVLGAVAIAGSPVLTLVSVKNAMMWRFEPNSEKSAVIVYNFRFEGVCEPGRWSSQMFFYPPNFAAVTACSRPTEP